MGGMKKKGPAAKPRKRRGEGEPADLGGAWDHRLRAGLGHNGYLPSPRAAGSRPLASAGDGQEAARARDFDPADLAGRAEFYRRREARRAGIA